MSDHPYSDLPSHAFWKTAGAETDPKQIDLQWRPKGPIDRNTRIVTVGSCFAQHISRALKDNGFRWIDSEPAPTDLPAAEHAKQPPAKLRSTPSLLRSARRTCSSSRSD